ncbi:methyl-accepting chemotaxis protein [Xylanibacillus composti]|uniref:methyl-accepting chemotaxis protein n=1 Tax=Xylanibacillus composti TaxID=1572762 RepID=UPI0028F74BF3|nr:methyl-accepting chemotaxis protein [Xylanibacillus composti]
MITTVWKRINQVNPRAVSTSDRQGSAWGNRFSQISLRNRLLILFIALLVLSTLAVGASSYMKAQQTLIHTVEDRLEREADVISYVVRNLKFVYVSDEQYFLNQLQMSIYEQKRQLESNGFIPAFFSLVNGEVVPFDASKDSSIQLSPAFLDEVSSGGDRVFHSKLQGIDYTVAVKTMPEIDGKYVLLVETSSYLGPIYQMAQFMLFIIMGCIAVSILLILWFVRSLTRPLTQLKRIMEGVRNGNMQQPISIRTKVPEIVSLQSSFATMLDQMRTVIGELKDTTNDLNAAGGKLSETSEEALSYSQQLIESIHVVKDGAAQTAEGSETSLARFHEMKEKIESIMQSMSEVFVRSVQMDDSAKQGEESVASLMDTIRKYETEFTHMMNTVEEVKKHSSSISGQVGLIQEVASRTKLLALNASIEAARAGEAGKGFSVVATEIRNLADQSSVAAEVITKSIRNMEQVASEAMEEFHRMIGKIEVHLKDADQSKGAWDNLLDHIDTVSLRLKAMQGELQGLQQSVPLLQEVMMNFASVSQETSASAEQILSLSYDQMAQMESTHVTGQELTKLAHSLSAKTKRFQLN